MFPKPHPLRVSAIVGALALLGCTALTDIDGYDIAAPPCEATLGLSCELYREAYIKVGYDSPGQFVEEGGMLGTSVSLDGDTLIMGSPGTQNGGSFNIYERRGGAWEYALGITSTTENMEYRFVGQSVSTNAGVAAIGLPGNDTVGGAWVYVRSNSGEWASVGTTLAPPTGGTAGDLFGWSVAVLGTHVAVSAPGHDSGDPNDPADESAVNSGAVFVYEFRADVGAEPGWYLEAYLKPEVIDAGDQFGASLALSEDHLVVGSIRESSRGEDPHDNSATASGAVYVFERSDWSQQAMLKAPTPDAGDGFGAAVAISGSRLVVGAPAESTVRDGEVMFESGAVHVFDFDGSTWNPTARLVADNRDASDGFGWSVAVDSDLVAVGAALEDSRGSGLEIAREDNGAPDAGAVYLFAESSTGFAQRAYIKAENTSAEDQFGAAISLSLGRLAIGAPREDARAEPFDDSLAEAGAVYVRRVRP